MSLLDRIRRALGEPEPAEPQFFAARWGGGPRAVGISQRLADLGDDRQSPQPAQHMGVTPMSASTGPHVSITRPPTKGAPGIGVESGALPLTPAGVAPVDPTPLVQLPPEPPVVAGPVAMQSDMQAMQSGGVMPGFGSLVTVYDHQQLLQGYIDQHVVDTQDPAGVLVRPLV